MRQGVGGYWRGNHEFAESSRENSARWDKALDLTSGLRLDRSRSLGNPADSKGPESIQSHFDFLDGLRALLALYVVGYHAWCIVQNGKSEGLGVGFSILAFGHYSVCFFIVLSGFCLMLPVLKSGLVLKNGVVEFIKRRAWRILPPYYFALGLSLVFIWCGWNSQTGDQWGTSPPLSMHNILPHIFLVHNFFPSDFFAINYVLWSIAVEWQIYFVFPLILIGWRAMGGLYATMAAIAASFLVELALHIFFNIQPRFFFVSLFALGMSAAYIGFSPRYKKLPWGVMTLVTLAVFCGTLPLDREMVCDFLFGATASLLLVAICHGRVEWLRRLLDFKPLVLIGTFSYSLYLVHALLLQTIWRFLLPMHFHPQMACLTLLVLGVPLIVLCSYVFHLGCELPFMKKNGRRTRHIK